MAVPLVPPMPPVPLVPPARDGVGPSCVALPAGAWKTMLEFLVERFPSVGPAQWLARMECGEVIDADGHRVLPDHPYRPHTRLYYYRSLPTEARIPFEEAVLFRDDYLIVADKPHFLPVTPSGRYLQETLLVRLKRKLGIDTLTPMHRIDRETAGLVLFTIQPATRDRYQALFRDRQVSKEYEAIAAWRPDLSFPLMVRSRLVESETFMQMVETTGLPNAETEIALLDRKSDLARYALRPVTGQKHQLRVQMCALGMPILNDQIYPRLVSPHATDADYGKPLQLLARSVSFTDPLTGAHRRFTSERRLHW